MLDYSREFLAVAACLNYSTAAGELNISKPTLSRHIADLEKELGFRLFERTPMALTPEGRYYLESISDVIDRLDTIIEEGQRMAEKGSQTLSVYMLPSEGVYSKIIYESVARMRKNYPEFSPRFCYNDRSYSVADAVFFGKADMGIVFEEPENLPNSFACEHLVDDLMAAWLHADNPLSKKQSLQFEDLENCSIPYSTNQSSRTWSDYVAGFYRKRGMEPKARLKDLENRESFFLEVGLDEALLQPIGDKTASQFNPSLVRVEFSDPTLVYSSYLLYRKQPEGHIVNRLIEMCHIVAAEQRGKKVSL